MERYARQTILPEIGKKGQELLGASKVLVVGVGALGTLQASFLARAGVGKIVLADRDIVELNNLQRQMLFDEGDIDAPKAAAARNHLRKVNSLIDIEAKVTDVNPSNIEELIAHADYVFDATDNMDTRYLINDVCVKMGKPWVYGGAVGTSGMVLSVFPSGPCFRCLFPVPPSAGDLPTCDTAGVLNTLPAVIAAFQVTEYFRMLTGKAVESKLLTIDIWTHEAKEIAVSKDPNCPTCSLHKYEFLQPGKKKLYTSICGRNAIQIVPDKKLSLSLSALAEKLSKAGDVKTKPGVLFFSTSGAEFTIFEDGRTIIKGIDDPVRARTLFSKYIGD